MSVQTIAKLQDKTVNITSNGEHTISPDSGYTAIHRLNIDVDVQASSEGRVNFIDFDGTLVVSYTGSELQALSVLPTAPDHTSDTPSLTFDTWNWTLADLKNYNTSYPDATIVVGANYHTTDGKNHLFFNITSPYDVTVKLDMTPSSGETIDWGDGVIESTSSNPTHEYSGIGLYHCIVDSHTPILGCSDQTYYGSRSSQLVKCFYSSYITTTTQSAFERCYNLKTISIPSSLQTVNARSFRYCYNIKCFVFPSGVTTIYKETFYYASSLCSVALPKSVNSLKTDCFAGCGFEAVLIPDGVTSIPGSAFYYCSSLRSVSISDTVTQIGESAFQGCQSLEDIAIPTSITSLGRQCFYMTGLKSVEVPASVTYLGDGAFAYDRQLKEADIKGSGTSFSPFQYCTTLQTVTIPTGVTTIYVDAFRENSVLKTVTIPQTVTTISSAAFRQCVSLQSLIIPDSVTTIGPNAFDSCTALFSIVIPTGVTSIESSTFISCTSLQSVTIPQTVTAIGSNAFQNCNSLQTVTIPSNVTTIGNYAFESYSLGTIVVMPTTPPTLSGSSVFKSSRIQHIYVPSESVAAYKAATNWDAFASIIEAIPS